MIKQTLSLRLLAVIGLLVALNACQPYNPQKTVKEQLPEIKKAICFLYPTEGNKVSGIVTFTKNDSGIVVIADIEGLSSGKHGFHIHEYGDCSSPDGSSAGSHFNPEGEKHGAPSDINRHVGDLGNIIANDEGKAHFELIDTVLSFKGDHFIIGRGIIVHEREDDLITQPTGNAGARVACGVIGIAK